MKAKKEKKNKPQEHFAKLVITGLPTMDKHSLKRLSLWLKTCSENIAKEAIAYSKVATFKLMK